MAISRLRRTADGTRSLLLDPESSASACSDDVACLEGDGSLVVLPRRCRVVVMALLGGVASEAWMTGCLLCPVAPLTAGSLLPGSDVASGSRSLLSSSTERLALRLAGRDLERRGGGQILELSQERAI